MLPSLIKSSKFIKSLYIKKVVCEPFVIIQKIHNIFTTVEMCDTL